MTISQFPIPASGIPSGDTAGRPAAPVVGTQYYNGQEGYLEIYTGSNWIPASAVPGQPTIAVADVATSVAYGSAQAAVTITAASDNISVDSFKAYASSGGYIGTSATSVVTITVGNNGTYSFTGTTFSPFGESSPSALVSATLTTVPQAPTIGTATTDAATTDIVVTWTLNSDGGKNLSAITVTPFLNGTTAQTATTAATTSSTSATIVGLTAGSSYTFKVKATNANGDSANSVATNSIVVPVFMSIDYLVVAGGGGGGITASGGGGGGGLRSTVTATGGSGSLESALTITKGVNYTVTIGAGGTAVSGTGLRGNPGADSVFSTVTSLGGGGGGGNNNSAGGSGGSGGGARAGGAEGTGNANQGFNGGTASGDTGAGGGGAAGVGSNSTTNTAGAGGAGRAVSITGSSVTLAGGGGGCSDQNTTYNNGGAGGGGSGAYNAPATNGTVNTGGGGGGSRIGGGSAGGSGVVVLRWLTADAGTITIGAGLTADATGTDGSHSYKRITAGSGNVSLS